MASNASSSRRDLIVEELSKKNNLCTLKEFLDKLDPNLMDEQRAIESYSRYKALFLQNALEKFFEAHKNEEWFLEKYHPELSKNYRQSMIKEAINRHHVFFNFYFDGKLDALELDDGHIVAGTSGSTTTLPHDNEMPQKSHNSTLENDLMDTEDKTYTQNEFKKDMDEPSIQESFISSYGSQHPSLELLKMIAPIPPMILIKSIHPTIKRSQILDIVSKLTGFKELILSSPNGQKRFHRIGWIVFETGVDLSLHEETLFGCKIEGFELHTCIYKPTYNRIRTVSDEYMGEQRLRADLKTARKLARHFDKHKGLENPILDPIEAKTAIQPAEIAEEDKSAKMESTEDGEESEDKCKRKIYMGKIDPDYGDIKYVKKELDLLIFYLRIVHLTCYYCGIATGSIEEMHRDCGHLHVRKHQLSNSSTSFHRDSGQSQKIVDDKIEEMLKRTPLLSLEMDNSNEGSTVVSDVDIEKQLINKYVQIVEEGDPKRRCKLCTKLFKSAEFLVKHLHLKHEEEISSIKFDKILFKRFLSNTEDWSSYILTPPTVLQRFSHHGDGYTHGQSYYNRQNYDQRSYRGYHGGGGHYGYRDQGLSGPTRNFKPSYGSHYHSEPYGGRNRNYDQYRGRERGGRYDSYSSRPSYQNRSFGAYTGEDRSFESQNRSQATIGDRSLRSYNDLDAPEEMVNKTTEIEYGSI